MIRTHRSLTRLHSRFIGQTKRIARLAGPYLAIAAALWALSARVGWFPPASSWAVVATAAFMLAATLAALDRLGVPRGNRSRNRRRAAAAGILALAAGVAAAAQIPLWIVAAAAPLVIAGHRAHTSVRRKFA